MEIEIKREREGGREKMRECGGGTEGGSVRGWKLVGRCCKIEKFNVSVD